MAMFLVQHGAIFFVSKDLIGMNFEEFFAVVFWGNHDLSIFSFLPLHFVKYPIISAGWWRTKK